MILTQTMILGPHQIFWNDVQNWISGVFCSVSCFVDTDTKRHASVVVERGLSSIMPASPLEMFRFERTCGLVLPRSLTVPSGWIMSHNYTTSPGAYVFAHDTVDRVLSDGPIDHAPVSIGNLVYLGPYCIVAKGVTIGDQVVVGANSLVNRDIPAGMKAFGTPARVVGRSLR